MALSKKLGCPLSTEWPDKAVSILLKTYAQKFSVDRGFLRTQDWQEVAHAVNSACENLKTLKQCRDKVDSLKRRYKMEKRKASSGGEVNWPFFHRLDDIMNSVLKQGKGYFPKHFSTSSAHASTDAEYEDDEEVEGFREEEDERVEEGVAEDKEEEQGADDGADDDDDENLDASASVSVSSDSPPYIANGRAFRHAEDAYGVSDEGIACDGYFYGHLGFPHRNDKLHRSYQNREGLHLSHAQHQPVLTFPDHPFLQRAPSRLHTVSGGTHESTQNSSQGKTHRARKSRNGKRKFECDNGIDALANAVTGLSRPGSTVCFSDVFAQIELAKVNILNKVRLEVGKLDRGTKRTDSPSKPHTLMSTSS